MQVKVTIKGRDKPFITMHANSMVKFFSLNHRARDGLILHDKIFNNVPAEFDYNGQMVVIEQVV
jgi:hypothetical protein